MSAVDVDLDVDIDVVVDPELGGLNNLLRVVCSFKCCMVVAKSVSFGLLSASMK